MSKACLRDGDAGTQRNFSVTTAQGSAADLCIAGRGAQGGLVVMKMVAAERSGFSAGGEIFDLSASERLTFRRFLWASATDSFENSSVKTTKLTGACRLVDGLVACRSHCGGGNDGFQPSGKSMLYGGYGIGKACGAAGRSRTSSPLGSRGCLSLHSD